MLIPFAIEPEAYKAVERYDLADKKILIKPLLAFWRNHGVLLVPTGNEWDEWVSNLDPYQRGLLMDAYKEDRKYRRKNTGEIRWDSLQTDADIAGCGDSLNVGMVVLEPTRATVLGLPAGAYCLHCGQVEITLWHYVGETCVATGLHELAQKRIRPQDTREAIWEQRLRDYAEYSRHVVIADPYAVRGISRTDKPSTALPFLLERLMGSERKNRKALNVSVFSTYDDRNPDDSFYKIKSDIENFCSSRIVRSSSVKKIDFYLLSEGAFHDRWLRFDSNVITLGHGLTVLERYARRQSDSTEFELKDDETAVFELINNEKKLKSLWKSLEHFTIP